MKIDQADKYFSLFIRTRDKWTCQRCKKQYTPPTNALHCSHFQGRAKENTRFNPDNACALCYGCHQYFTSQPAEHYAWQVKRLGQKKVDKIVLASSMYVKKDRKLQAIYWKKEYQKLLDNIQQ